MTLANVLLIIVLITLNGFFVGVEFAVVASRRSRLDLIDDSDRPAARIVRTWLEQPAARNRLIAAAQLGITIVSLALGAVGENTFEAWLEPYFENLVVPTSLVFLEHIFVGLPLFISLTVVTSLHVVLGEQVPKVAALRFPEQIALKFAPIMRVFSVIFKWFIDILDWATYRILEIFGLPASGSHASVITSEELMQIVSGPESEGVIEEEEREMISAVIEFGDLIVRHVYIPRLEIIAVRADTPISEVIQTASKNMVTKMPVYEESLEQIIGIVNLLDLLQISQEKQKELTVRDVAREALFVPENIPVSNLLYQFRNRRTHIAIVLDEFGGTAGLVTLEDLLEEIVGEVHDPYDSEQPPIQTLTDGSTLIEGKVLIEEFNDHFDLDLDDPNYDTIAGYILGKLGRIPQEGDMVEDLESGVRLKVYSMDRLRISQVHMTRR